MSTRSNIAIKRKDGTYEKIYCHCDGYLENNGLILDMYYKDIDKINNLLDLGDLSSLGLRVNPDPSIPHSFDYEERQEDVTVAYGRDRGEQNTQKKVFKNYNEFINSFKNTGCEFVYLYEEERNEWLYSPIPYNNSKELYFVSLYDKLKEKNLIDEVDEKFDSLIRDEVNLLYDYDTYEFKDCYESYEDAYFETKKILEKEKGISSIIRMNKEFLDSLEEDLDNPEIRKVFDDGLHLNDRLRAFRKEFEKIKEEDNNIEI